MSQAASGPSPHHQGFSCMSTRVCFLGSLFPLSEGGGLSLDHLPEAPMHVPGQWTFPGPPTWATNASARMTRRMLTPAQSSTAAATARHPQLPAIPSRCRCPQASCITVAVHCELGDDCTSLAAQAFCCMHPPPAKHRLHSWLPSHSFAFDVVVSRSGETSGNF